MNYWWPTQSAVTVTTDINMLWWWCSSQWQWVQSNQPRSPVKKQIPGRRLLGDWRFIIYARTKIWTPILLNFKINYLSNFRGEETNETTKGFKTHFSSTLIVFSSSVRLMLIKGCPFERHCLLVLITIPPPKKVCFSPIKLIDLRGQLRSPAASKGFSFWLT